MVLRLYPACDRAEERLINISEMPQMIYQFRLIIEKNPVGLSADDPLFQNHTAGCAFHHPRTGINPLVSRLFQGSIIAATL